MEQDNWNMNVFGRYYYNLTCKDAPEDKTLWYLDDETYEKYKTLMIFGKNLPEGVSEEEEEKTRSYLEPYKDFLKIRNK